MFVSTWVQTWKSFMVVLFMMKTACRTCLFFLMLLSYWSRVRRCHCSFSDRRRSACSAIWSATTAHSPCWHTGKPINMAYKDMYHENFQLCNQVSSLFLKHIIQTIIHSVCFTEIENEIKEIIRSVCCRMARFWLSVSSHKLWNMTHRYNIDTICWIFVNPISRFSTSWQWVDSTLLPLCGFPLAKSVVCTYSIPVPSWLSRYQMCKGVFKFLVSV